MTRAFGATSSRIALAIGILGCGSPAAPARPTSTARTSAPARLASGAPATAPRASASAIASVATPTPPRAARDPLDPALRGVAPGCAYLTFGYDLRALPVGASPGMVDGYVSSQAEDVRAAGVAEGVELRLFTQLTSVHAVFDADRDEDALAACERTAKRYLATAPTLPRIGGESAVSTIRACGGCEGR